MPDFQEGIGAAFWKRRSSKAVSFGYLQRIVAGSDAPCASNTTGRHSVCANSFSGPLDGGPALSYLGVGL